VKKKAAEGYRVEGEDRSGEEDSEHREEGWNCEWSANACISSLMFIRCFSTSDNQNEREARL
jgi:hypothetical protein